MICSWVVWITWGGRVDSYQKITCLIINFVVEEIWELAQKNSGEHMVF